MAQTRSRNNGGVDLTSRTIQRLAAPPASLLTRSFNSFADFEVGLMHAGALRRENARLQAIVNATEDYSPHIQRLEDSYEDLRRAEGFRDIPGKTRIPAEVSGIFAYDNRITLSVGSNQGVEPGMPVVSGRGLLAIVQTVDPDHCQALLLISAVTHIGAITNRRPPPEGLLRGDGGGVLLLDFIDPNSIVQNGDEAVTSGNSDRIPRDIPIGRIIKVDDIPAFGLRRGIVFPWATLGAASEVYVLK